MKWPCCPHRWFGSFDPLRDLSGTIDRVDAGRKKIDLIETVAFQLVQKIFESYAFVEKVRLGWKTLGSCSLAIRETCSVTIEREKKQALIGLGTNMGDKQLQLETALEKSRIEAFIFFRHLQGLKQNLGEEWSRTPLRIRVAEVETWMTPEGFTRDLLAIEQEMGRVRVRSSGATCDWSRSALHGGTPFVTVRAWSYRILMWRNVPLS